MKGVAFYAEMPDSWVSKKACKRHKAWTRKYIKEWAASGGQGTVVAVLLGPEHRTPEGDGQECLSSTFYFANSDVSMGAISFDILRDRTTRIDEATARKLHPRLFERLDFD